MIKRLQASLLLICCVGAGLVKAQQDPYYAHFMLNKVNYNPAFAGADAKGYMCANVLYHKQWTGWENAPVTQNVNLNFTPKLGAWGLGLSLENDKQGFETTLSPRFSFGYGFNIGTGSSLRVGASAGFQQKGLAGDKLKPLSQILNTGNDPSVPASAVSALKPDFGFGLYYNNTNFYNLYVGLSATHLVENQFTYQVGASGSVFSTSRRHMYLVSGCEIPLSSFILYPTVLFKYDFAKAQIDLNLYGEFNGKWGAALAYRNDQFRADAITLMGRYKFSTNTFIGYSYDLTLSKLGPFASNSYGTHEIVINHCFKLKTKVKTPTEYIKGDSRWLRNKKR